MKVSDLIGDYAHPAGDQGRDVPAEDALKMAEHMRWLLDFNQDRDQTEERKAFLIYAHDRVLNREQSLYLASWEFLNAMERRAWKEYTNLGKYNYKQNIYVGDQTDVGF